MLTGWRMLVEVVLVFANCFKESKGDVNIYRIVLQDNLIKCNQITCTPRQQDAKISSTF